MKGLIKTEFIPLRGFAPKGVQLFVWDKSESLIANTPNEGYETSALFTAVPPEEQIVSGCHVAIPFYTSKTSIKTKGKSKVISELHFNLDHWGIATITHEVAHLIFWMQTYIGIEAITDMPMQEKWCYAIGELAETIAKILSELDKP